MTNTALGGQISGKRRPAMAQSMASGYTVRMLKSSLSQKGALSGPGSKKSSFAAGGKQASTRPQAAQKPPAQSLRLAP